MAKQKTNVLKPFQKTTNTNLVSAIELLKAYRVMDLREELGYSAYELSFMLGKDSMMYVRDAEDPLKTLKYDPSDVNYLALILRKPFSSILLPSAPEKHYQIQVITYPDKTRRIVFEIAIKDDKSNYIHFKTYTQERKMDILPTPLNTYTYDEVIAYINVLLADNFFEIYKTALEVLDSCRKHFGEDFHPRHMIAVLNFYTNKKSGVPLLDYTNKNDCGRKVFRKNPNSLSV